MRTGNPSQPKTTGKGKDDSDNEWPAPALDLFTGRRQPQAVLSAASDADERCQAHYYVGQWHLVRKNTVEASNEFKKAVEVCQKGGLLQIAANTEQQHI